MGLEGSRIADQLGARLGEDGPPWWLTRRAQGLSSLEAGALPKKRDDAWWGVSPARYFDVDWAARARQPVEVVRAWRGLAQWVFIDGREHPCSTREAVPDGVTVRTFREAFAQGEGLSELLGSSRPSEGEGIGALSMALHEDGLWIDIEEGVQVDRPLVLVHASSAGERAGAVGLRVVVRVAKGASARVVEHWCGASRDLSVATTEVVLAEDARLDWIKLQDLTEEARHVHQLCADVHARANLQATSLAVGGKLARTELRVGLKGAGAHAELRGLTLGCREQVQDHYVWIDHEVAECTSEQVFRSLAADRARGLFTGRVVVCPDAQRTVAEQQHDSLLLSETAVCHTRPQLEIYADDVSCRHGATVGQLDKEALFYLRQRGLDERVAHELLLGAFTGEIFASLPDDPVRTQLTRCVERWCGAMGVG